MVRPMTERIVRRAALSALVAGAAVVAASFASAPRLGRIRGVGYGGPAPKEEVIDMSSEEYCAQANAGRTVVSTPVRLDGQVVSDVIVYVKEGLPRQSHPAPRDSVLLDQRGCMYEPRVVALRTGQSLVVQNSDATLHNVRVRAERNRGFNIGQPIKGLRSRRSFTASEVGIRAACDIHGWMHAVIAVFDHPYFAVSTARGFELDALPPGEYVLEAWHATLGTRTQRVTVAAAGTSEVVFQF
jgi:hypothetical protein